VIPHGTDVNTNRYLDEPRGRTPVPNGTVQAVEFTERLVAAIEQKVVPDHRGKPKPIGYNALGKAIGKEQSGYISTLIKERRTPVVETIRELAKALDVRFEWLADGTGEMKAPGSSAQAPEAGVVGVSEPSRTIRSYDPRYPNFDLGAEIVRRERDDKDAQLAEAAIDRVSKRLHDYGGDAMPTRWAQLIVAELDIMRTARRGLAQDVERARKKDTADDARAAAMEEQTKPKLPFKKR
jgi:hypothetical protein